MTTKEQERKALEQIKNILATLDADGWVRTAFEGCIDYAEDNIENDFALSYKEAYESEQKRSALFQSELIEAEKKLEQQQTTITSLQEQIVSRKDLDECLFALRKAIQQHEAKRDEAAKQIVQCADDPSCEDFRNAVQTHRFYADRAAALSDAEGRVYTAYTTVCFAK